MAMCTDPVSTLEGKSCIKVVGGDMTRLAAAKALKQAGVSATDVQVSRSVCAHGGVCCPGSFVRGRARPGGHTAPHTVCSRGLQSQL
jgi:hypothetical protein